MEVFVSASETHSLKNSGVGVAEALETAARMIDLAQRSEIGVTAGVMCAFGCFYEGAVAVERVVEIVSALEASSPAEIGLADTTGMARPEDIKRVIESVGSKVGVDRLAIHLHDTSRRNCKSPRGPGNGCSAIRHLRGWIGRLPVHSRGGGKHLHRANGESRPSNRGDSIPELM